jgi:hypothetical protein
MPDKKPRRQAKKSMSDYDRMLAGIDESRLNARGRAALAQMRQGPTVKANAVPRLSDIARSIAAVVKPTQASRAGGISPLAKISNTIGNTVLGYDPVRGKPPAKKRKMASPPKAAPKRRSAAPTKSRRRPARRSAKVY